MCNIPSLKNLWESAGFMQDVERMIWLLTPIRAISRRPLKLPLSGLSFVVGKRGGACGMQSFGADRRRPC
ncbi:hypothetical protein MesoLjLc_66980 [Mesorhizobium sp. L-8-10]|nr:hypothetical protein MesoLjLc_66980 [Mesorhizobium sp. L-8-10]